MKQSLSMAFQRKHLSIVDIQVDRLSERLKARKLDLNVDAKARALLADRGLICFWRQTA